MSFGIVRYEKFKASDVRGIQSHDHREREPHTNPDIDQSKKAENYALADVPHFTEAIQKRLKTLESNKAVRKDAIVMCQMLITSDSEFFKNLTPEKEKAFFQQSLDFIAGRYGRENIIAATVHKDEKTPHMHINFTPIKGGKLTANAIFNRKELHNLQDEFHRSVGRSWGLQRGESREEKRKHLDTEEFKNKTRIEAMQKELDQARTELDKTKAELSAFKGVQEGTAKALAQAQSWSMEKARQEVERRQKEREQQATLERAKAEEKQRQEQERAAQRERNRSRGLGMGR